MPLLIIDDFGLKPLRPPADEDLHDLVAERYEQAATVVTSNLDFAEWGQAFPANRLLASATVDRLRYSAYCLVLDGDSFRASRLAPRLPRSRVANVAKNTQAGTAAMPALAGSITPKTPGSFTARNDMEFGPSGWKRATDLAVRLATPASGSRAFMRLSRKE